MTKIQEGQIYRNLDTGNTWRVTDASRPLIRLEHVETEDRAQLSRGAIARFYILQDPAAPLAAVAHANLRTQVAAEIWHADSFQAKPRFTLQAGRGICRDGEHILSISRAGGAGMERVTPTEADSLTRRIVDLLNQHGEG